MPAYDIVLVFQHEPYKFDQYMGYYLQAQRIYCYIRQYNLFQYWVIAFLSHELWLE